ncbi:MAG: hypothetical protein CM1200mP2_20860 [Planctomycetaceae bacterium]|nr:MAG: hypothetical protein CM1200mP2_20860 [Planctomycetaceae bacterium]
MAIPARAIPHRWSSQAGLADIAQEKGLSLRALCVDRKGGTLTTTRVVPGFGDFGTEEVKNSFASPTPIIEKDRVYIHFGQRGAACLSTSGEGIWKNTSLQYSQPYSGASTPILFKDSLILTCDGTDSQFVVALNKRTGKVVWKTVRTHFKERAKPLPLMAYSTPLIVTVDGVPQIVSSAADHAAAYDARTGREIWWLRYDGFSEVFRPVTWRGLVFLQGFENVSEVKLYAVRPNGKGEITKTHVEWKLDRGAPFVPSPLVVGDELYTVSDAGIASCLDARTGADLLEGPHRRQPFGIPTLRRRQDLLLQRAGSHLRAGSRKDVSTGCQERVGQRNHCVTGRGRPSTLHSDAVTPLPNREAVADTLCQ